SPTGTSWPRIAPSGSPPTASTRTAKERASTATSSAPRRALPDPKRELATDSTQICVESVAGTGPALLCADRGAVRADVLVVDVGEHGRLDVPALGLIGRDATPGGDLGAFLLALGDVAEHPVLLALGHERADLRRLVERVADHERPGLLGERLDDLVVAAAA